MGITRSPLGESAQAVLHLAQSAAAAILRVYARAPNTRQKADLSPVTDADIAAHTIIAAGLAHLTPTIPVLSEEGRIAPWSERRTWSRFWLVDPLDGTKEFIARNGEFTVNIALIDAGYPTLGVIVQPTTGHWFVAAAGAPLLRGQAPAPRPGGSGLIAAVSRSHADDALRAMFAARGGVALAPIGSSLKFCRIADGAADVYAKRAGTSMWDTAAGQAVVESAGGTVVDRFGERLGYSRADVANPPLLAARDAACLRATMRGFAAL